MTADTDPKLRPEEASTEDKAQLTIGWLSTLRQRFGLSGPQSLRDTLELALKEEDQSGSAFSAGEREMLRRLLRFGASRVDDIMVPRADIIALEENEPISDLIRMFVDAGVSRIPVFHDTLDDPRGMIHIKDLFRWLIAQTAHPASGAATSPPAPPSANGGTRPEPIPDLTSLDLASIDLTRPIAVTKLRRQVLYVPPSMPATNLLIRMQTTRIHMALVVDEYGGTDGLVTIEDLVEQIVGDIEDEHDVADQHIAVDPKLGLTASARTPAKELEDRLGIKLLTPEDEEEIDTLGGLVFAIVGRVPARGEIVRHSSGVEFEVLDADPRRVKKLRIHVGRLQAAEQKKP